MALIVEDGSIVEGANSFADLAFIRSYALEIGVTLSADDEELSADAVNGFRYINSKETLMQGSRISAVQDGCFPRTGVNVFGFDVADNEIPKTLKQAQAQLCIEQHNGVDIMPTATEAALKSKKVGPLEWEWDTTGSTSEPTMPKVDDKLRPLFNRSSVGLSTYRA